VEWHLRRAWAPLLFEDEERQEERQRRDPILPAQPSASAQRKKRTHQTGEGIAVQSFKSLLGELARRARVIYALKSEKAGEKSNLTFSQVPEPTPLQRSEEHTSELQSRQNLVCRLLLETKPTSLQLS